MNKYLIILSLLLFSIALPVLSQEEDPPNITWVRLYESQNMMGRSHWFNDIFAIPGGGYALGGGVYMRINHHAAWLLVTEEGGQVVVDRRFEYAEQEAAFVDCFSVIKTDDGGYLMGGRTQIGGGGGMNFDVIKVRENGELQWWSVFGDEAGFGCHALIELKGGNFVAAGQNANHQAYAVMIDENGDAVWENYYQGAWLFGLREVADEGLLFSGFLQMGTAFLLKTNYDGDVEWSNSYIGGSFWSLVSCPAGGFAAGGQASNNAGFFLCRMDHDGNLLWAHNYPLFERLEIATGLAAMVDGGFTMSGYSRDERGRPLSATVRTDSQGNVRWRRTGDLLPQRPNDAQAQDYGSVIVKPDGSLVYCGKSQREDDMEELRREGVVVCLDADRSAPHIVGFSPDSLHLTVLTGDSVWFAVRAEDLQDDSLSYVWTLDNRQAGNDTFAVVTFDESGLHGVKCVVSDGALADSVMWRIEVRDFFIRSAFPEGHELAVRRNSVYNFGLDVAVIDGLELFYTWTFTGRDRRQLVIGQEDSVSVHFPLTGDNQLDVSVQGGEEIEDMTWDIQVRSCLWWWWPHDLEMTVPQDTLIDFVVFPFNPASDSMRYRWELDGEMVEDVESDIELMFDEIGEHNVTSYVSEGVESDTVTWVLNVVSEDFAPYKPDNTVLPSEPVLYSASPNPFNGTTNISFFAPARLDVNLSVYDLRGRMIRRIIQQTVTEGHYKISFDAGNLPSGYYLLRFVCGNKEETKKILLLR